MNSGILVLRSFSRFISLSVLLITLAGTAQAQGTGVDTEITGEASVVIYDDFVNDRSETRYYLIDRGKGKETRLFFNNGAPEAFTTGKKVKVHGRGRPDGLDVDSLTEMDDGSGTGSDQTSSAPIAGAETRNVLTILVDFNDAVVNTGTANGINLEQAKGRMFTEAKSVAGWFWNSSLRTLTIPPDPDGDGIKDVFGPYQINDNYRGTSADCTASTWVDLARAAWQTANPTKNIGLYRHTLLIVPNYWDYSGRACTWGGVAQVGCGTWCWAIGADPRSIFHGVLAHELGHNFGLHHASTDLNNDGILDSEYDDTSDTMGSSRAWMKFNTPHIEDKGWIDPVSYELRTIVASSSAQTFDLLALDEEAWVWPGLRALKLDRTATSDYYLSYRLPAGDYNEVNAAYRNKLNIHYGTDNSTRSYFVTALSAGQTYNDPHNNLIITATGEVTITVGGRSTKVMGVKICKGVCSNVAAPSNLTATADGTSAINLAWSDNSSNENGFRLEHSPTGSVWSWLADVNVNVTSFSHAGLATGSTHFYRVLAYNASENSGWSNTASATTAVPPPPPPGQASSPNPAHPASNVSINADLSWTAGANASSHNVYFGATSPPASKGTQAATSYDPGTLNSSTTYYWRIDEVNSGGTTTGIVWSFTTAAGAGPSLVGSSLNNGKTWTAQVRNSDGSTLLTGTWSTGTSPCTIQNTCSLSGISKKVASVKFTRTSDGAQITVLKP